jgi:hypothetical protein
VKLYGIVEGDLKTRLVRSTRFLQGVNLPNHKTKAYGGLKIRSVRSTMLRGVNLPSRWGARSEIEVSKVGEVSQGVDLTGLKASRQNEERFKIK